MKTKVSIINNGTEDIKMNIFVFNKNGEYTAKWTNQRIPEWYKGGMI